MSRRTVIGAAALAALMLSMLGVGAAMAQVPDIALAIVGPTPNPAVPGSVSQVEVHVTPNVDITAEEVKLDITGTGGEGTLTFISGTNGLNGCVETLPRVVTCQYTATSGSPDAVLTVDINVGSGASTAFDWNIHAGAIEIPPGGTYEVNANATLSILEPASTTTTTTSTTTTTAPASTTTTAPASTSSTLPVTGIDEVKGPMIVGLVLVMLGILSLGATNAFTRRRS